MDNANAYTFVDREFYETLSRYALEPDYVEVLRDLLPDAWNLVRDGVWVGANYSGEDGVPGPEQGFKIHVSATTQCALPLLRLVVPECVAETLSFKIAGDSQLLNMLNSKNYARGYSGKFMTLYPPNEAVFKRIIERLYLKTRHEPVYGPYILSDRRYKDSKVLFYRYGGFKRMERLQIDGTVQMLIKSAQGTWIPDARLPYFQLPEGIADPFGGASGVEHEGGQRLKGRYNIETVLTFKNSGGVYGGTDTTTGLPVVIKEARPYTSYWSGEKQFLDAVKIIEREYAILQRLEHLDFVVTPIDLFTEWEHTFLVEERLEGATFRGHQANPDILFAPYIRQKERIKSFIPRFKSIATDLIAMVKAVHESGVIFGDLSPGNILIDPDTLKMKLIDFESAIYLGEDTADNKLAQAFASKWYTPGFGSPQRLTRKEVIFEDDYYALGMLLYSCVAPVQNLFYLAPEAKDTFINEFVRLGLPVEVKHIINHLLDGKVDAAEQVVHTWDTASFDHTAPELIHTAL